MNITVFENIYAKTGTTHSITLEGLAKRCENAPVVPVKTDGRLFSLATFNGTRALENITEVSGIALDFDGTAVVDGAFDVATCGGFRFLLFTTYSHRIDGYGDCFRIVIPFSQPLTDLKRFEWTYRYFERLFEGLTDSHCRDASRMFFTPMRRAENAPFDYQLWARGEMAYFDPFCDGVNKIRLEEEQEEAERKRKAEEAAAKRAEISLKDDGTKLKKYIEAAVNGCAGEILRASKGNRHDSIAAAAFSLGQLVPDYLDENEAIEVLHSAGIAVGKDEREVNRTILDCMAAGMQKPRAIPLSVFEKVQPRPTRQQQWELEEAEEAREVVSHAHEYTQDIGESADDIIAYRRARQNAVNVSTGYAELDKHYLPVQPALTVMTGRPNSGKSSFVDNIAANLIKGEDWRWAIISFETLPIQLHQSLLISLMAGKPYSLNREDCLTDDEIATWCRRLKGNLVFHQLPPSARTVPNCLALLEETVKKYEPHGLIFDPWAELMPPQGFDLKGTEFVQDGLTRLREFSYSHNLHSILVAHPAKRPPQAKALDKDRVLDLEDIAGSAHFNNKADYGLTTHRHDPGGDDDHTEIFVTKVRRGLPGRIGSVRFEYDKNDGSYFESNRRAVSTSSW